MEKDVCTDRKGGDKLTHFVVSFAIMCVLGTVLAHILAGRMWVSLAVVTALCLAVGVGKELWDSHKKGNHFCVWDLLADALGALTGAPIVWLASWAMNATFY